MINDSKIKNVNSSNWKNILLSFLSSYYLPIIVFSLACIGLFSLHDSFWRDESKLLLNIIDKSFIGLMGHLDYDQEGPIIFLMLYRLIYLLGGKSELIFRFVSLVAAFWSILIFQKLTKKLFEEKPIILFLNWLFALSPSIIFFSSQAKQYSIDILVSTFLLWFTLPIFISLKPTNKQISLISIFIAIAPWLSLPTLFLVVPISIIIFFNNKNSLYIRFKLIFPSIISCTLVSLIAMRSMSNGSLKLASAFPVLNLSDSPLTILKTIINSVFFSYIGFADLHNKILLLSIFILILLSFIGIINSYKKHGWLIPFLLVTSIIIPLFLISIKIYPTLGRAFLFATPIIYLLIGFGITFCYQYIQYRKILYILLILLLVPCIMKYWKSYTKKCGGVKQAIEYIYQNLQPETLLLCDNYSASSVELYKELKHPAANSFNYLIPPKEWIEGEIITDQIDITDLLSPYKNKSIVFIAEKGGYIRNSDNRTLSEFSSNISKHLEKLRTIEYSYTTKNVQVTGFSKEN